MSIDRAILFRLATCKRFEQAVKRVPGGEYASWRVVSRYVAGESQREALDATMRLLEEGHGVSVDLFGERVQTPAEADDVLQRYLELVLALPPAPADVWVSLDLSHLALSTDPGRSP